jgi:S1-C subfamily serine protease
MDDPDNEPLPGAGEEPEDDRPRPPLPPDDRLWRHPSEVRGHLQADSGRHGYGLMGRLNSWFGGGQGPTWAVGVISGAVGAALVSTILLATGTVGNNTTVVPTTQMSRATVPQASGSGVATPIWSYVSPSIVGLTVTGDQGTQTESGVIVDSAGENAYLLTDSGLFSEAGPGAQIQVMVSDTIVPGYLVGVDPSAGIAVVRAAVSPVHTADLGTVASLQTGDEVYAVGSAWAATTSDGSGNYFATGEVNDTLNYLQPLNGATDGLFSMLLADLTVDPSAYGGALVDDTGKVVGILSPASSELNKPSVTYVTPIDTAMEELDALITTGEPAPHPWLGVLEASDAAVQSHVPGGVSVASLAPGSPAAKAGIVDNDIITSIDSNAVPSTGTLIFFLDSAKPGQVIKVSWLHQGHLRHADLTLGTQPASVNLS